MLATTIRKIIAPVLHECPSSCGIVTITEVEVSSDFSHATVYVSALYEAEGAIEYLEKHIKKLQHVLIQSLQRKRVPKLRFRLDERTERGKRVDELLEC